jgi:hypothetical protein
MCQISRHQTISPSPRSFGMFRSVASFYGEEFLAPRPNPKLDDQNLSAFRDCIFNICAGNLHISEVRFSICNLRTRHVLEKTKHRGALCSVLLIIYNSGDQIEKNEMGRHVAGTWERRSARRIFVETPGVKTRLGRIRHRCEDKTKMDL